VEHPGSPGGHSVAAGGLVPRVEAGLWRPSSSAPRVAGAEGVVYVSMFKLRVGLLGLLAVVLLGAFSAAPALAEGGPYCWHRGIGETESKGLKITGQEPEEIAGRGGKQRLAGPLGIVLESEQVQVKGILYNNPDQCQAKVILTYSTPKVVGEPNCEVKLNGNNIVKLFGHQAWKWDGTAAQLLEKPQMLQHRDWIFLPVELQQGATTLPTGTPFTTITITSKSEKEKCNPLFLLSQAKVEGSATAAGFINPQKTIEDQKIGTFGTVEEIRVTGGEGAQHFWNGTKFIGVQTGLKFIEPSKYTGTLEVNPIGKQGKTPPQEIAYFEE
jgi:hypothetical protein